MVGREVEASHTVSLQPVKCTVQMAGLWFDTEELRTWVNRLEKLENVSRRTNQSTYTIIDNAMERKFKNGELQTTEEEVNYVQEDCPKDFLPHIQKLFEVLHTKGGISIWEMVPPASSSSAKEQHNQATGADNKGKRKGPN